MLLSKRLKLTLAAHTSFQFLLDMTRNIVAYEKVRVSAYFLPYHSYHNLPFVLICIVWLVVYHLPGYIMLFDFYLFETFNYPEF